jgi:hypothetical protein
MLSFVPLITPPVSHPSPTKKPQADRVLQNHKLPIQNHKQNIGSMNLVLVTFPVTFENYISAYIIL